MSITGQENCEPNGKPRINGSAEGENELDYFRRVLREAERDKARRFLEWSSERTLRDVHRTIRRLGVRL